MRKKIQTILFFLFLTLTSTFAFQNCSKNKSATPTTKQGGDATIGLPPGTIDRDPKITQWSYNYNHGYWSGYRSDFLEGQLINNEYSYRYEREGCEADFTVRGNLTTRIYEHLSTMDIVDVQTYKDSIQGGCYVADGPATYYKWADSDGRQIIAAMEGCFSDSLPNDLTHIILKDTESELYEDRVQDLVDAVEDSLCTDN